MRIWFNRGYSLAAIAHAIMTAEPSLEIFASVGEGMPQRPGPIETWVEPKVEGEEYIAWVHETIVANKIDIFVPTRHRSLIAQATLPCQVVLPGIIPVLELLEDKYGFAQATKHSPYHLPTRAIASSDALSRAIATFPETNEPGATPCVKPRNGVNGLGFWKLTQSKPTSHLDNPDARMIRSDLYISALREQEKEAPIKELVLMEYLPGPEISFDVLCHKGVMLKYAARTKIGGNIQRIQSEHLLGKYVADLVTQFALSGVINVQFRRHNDGNWKLLEINARPAGGSVYSEKVGSRILADWALLMAGRITPEKIRPLTIDTQIALTTTIEEIVA